MDITFSVAYCNVMEEDLSINQNWQKRFFSFETFEINTFRVTLQTRSKVIVKRLLFVFYTTFFNPYMFNMFMKFV